MDRRYNKVLLNLGSDAYNERSDNFCNLVQQESKQIYHDSCVEELPSFSDQENLKVVLYNLFNGSRTNISMTLKRGFFIYIYIYLNNMGIVYIMCNTL